MKEIVPGYWETIPFRRGLKLLPRRRPIVVNQQAAQKTSQSHYGSMRRHVP